MSLRLIPPVGAKKKIINLSSFEITIEKILNFEK